MENAGQFWRLERVFNPIDKRKTLGDVLTIDTAPTV
jgi:hypothetical protein